MARKQLVLTVLVIATLCLAVVLAHLPQWQAQAEARAQLEHLAAHDPKTEVFAGVFFHGAEGADYVRFAEKYVFRYPDIQSGLDTSTLVIGSDEEYVAKLYVRAVDVRALADSGTASDISFASIYALPEDLLGLWEERTVTFICPDWGRSACTRTSPSLFGR